MDYAPDVQFFGGNLYDIYTKIGSDGEIDFTGRTGNRIRLDGKFDRISLQNTNVYFSGKNNSIHLTGLQGVSRLDVACIDRSKISLKSPQTIRGMTVLSSNGGSISFGAGCLVSRDVIVYASNAHGVYDVSDGSKRFKNSVGIGERVWLGQGARVLAGAEVNNGSVIGSYSVLAGKIPNNCAAAGNPCRVVRRDIFWTNQTTEDDRNYYDMLADNGKTIPRFIRPTEEGV